MHCKHLLIALLSTTLACAPRTELGDVIASDTVPVDAGAPPAGCLNPTGNPRPLVAAPCPIIICGDNAPNAGDGLLFDELNLFGTPNYAGVQLTRAPGVPAGGPLLSATFRGRPARLDMVRDQITVTDSTGTYHGTDLIGTVISLRYAPTGEAFDLRIACYDDTVVKYLAGKQEFVPVYDIQARRQGKQSDEWFRVCNSSPLLPDPSWIGAPYHALAFRAERYSHSQKAAIPSTPADGWSFLACNGSAGSKMHLYRHTWAGSFDAMGAQLFPTSIPQRTTMLKAITADYCGGGFPDFTVAGQPLAFEATFPASNPVFPFPHASASATEAVWGPNGAVCLNTPRRVTLGDVARVCPLPPPCDAASPPPPPPTPGWQGRGHVVTAIP